MSSVKLLKYTNYFFCLLKKRYVLQILIFTCTFHRELEGIYFSDQNVSAYKMSAAVSVHGNLPFFSITMNSALLTMLETC